MNKPLERFQDLLRELFQFNSADLDFGIYRIMNHKRDVIEGFIRNDLPETIADELGRGALADQSQAVGELKSFIAQIKGTLPDAFDADGNLVEGYKGTPLEERYLALKVKAASARDRDTLETAIYNYLYTFFSRYYRDGDFISQRRYSKRERYAIPYNGEEIYLYWANHDQYYVKTVEQFTDYTFSSRSVTIHFRLRAADVEQNNVKGDKRFFLSRPVEIAWDEATSQLVIPFEYRPLTGQEEITYGPKNQQDAIIAKALVEIPRRLSLKTAAPALAALQAERRTTSDGQPVTYLEHHLRQYTRRNTSDYFIHKDLQSFLSRELDFYLKNEVLNLDELDAAGEDRAEGWFQIMRVIKTVGSRIIAFLTQIEEFQKMLWEKRKFITETHYCITVGNITEAFYPEIAACDAQWDEWKELYHVDEEQADLFTSNKQDRRIAFLQTYPTLALDTKHFDHDFVDRLLGSFDDLDEIIDGLLIHSENWQALNLLAEKYREKVKCIYIDPPYNTGNDGFLYLDAYRHSSWITMIQNRLQMANEMIIYDGYLFSSIDEHEVDTLLKVLDIVFPQRVGIVTVQTNPKGRGQDKYFATSHDYLVSVTKHRDARLRGISKSGKQLSEYSDGKDEHGPYRLLELRNTHRQFHRGTRPNLWYPFYVDIQSGAVSLTQTKESVEVYPLWPDGFEGCWTWGKDLAAKRVNFLVGRQVGNRWTVYRKDHANKDGWVATFMPKTIWNEPEVRTEYGQKVLDEVLGKRIFNSPKPPTLISKVLQLTMHNDEWAMDYFAGSGTTAHSVINLNRNDGSRRKFILVEMANYFDTVLLPRLKKVTYTPEWKDGKPKRMATVGEAACSPRIVKYFRLESYEDALNNIAFDDASGQQAMQFKDYRLQYMLKWETRQSETLLNVAKLARPFDYRLHIHANSQTCERLVDIPETFNYLLGLHVQTRRVYCDDGGRRYLVVRGRIDHRTIAVIWRETEGWQEADFERDRQFVVEHKLAEGADEVFVNGDSFIPNARALEPIFKARMFAPVE